MDIVTVVEKNVGDFDSGKNSNLPDKLIEAFNSKSGPASLFNRQEYEKRLLTFKASTYYAKPPCLSPLFCARFGWENADKDMLVCSSCGSALAITLNSNLSAKTFDKLCQAYRNKIVSCHTPSCPFRLSSYQQRQSLDGVEIGLDSNEKENGTSDIEQVRPIVPVYMSQVLPEDSIRLMEHRTPSIILRQNVKKISDTVRSISRITKRRTNSDLAGASSSSLSWRFPKLQIPSEILQTISSNKLPKFLDCDDESILALSLLGWIPIPTPNVLLNDSAPVVSLGCPCCLSIMDIGLIQLDQRENEGITEDNDENEIDRLSKRQRIMSTRLNPLDACRHYCPFKVGFPVKAGDTNPVWKAILKRLCEEIHYAKTGNPTTIEEMSIDVADGVLDKSVDNVRRILRAGIARRDIDIMV